MLHDALCLFPCSVPAMYLKAIACQVMWAAVGPLRIRRPDVLEEGLEWLRKVRRRLYTPATSHPYLSSLPPSLPALTQYAAAPVPHRPAGWTVPSGGPSARWRRRTSARRCGCCPATR